MGITGLAIVVFGDVPPVASGDGAPAQAAISKPVAARAIKDPAVFTALYAVMPAAMLWVNRPPVSPDLRVAPAYPPVAVK